jgi:disulfide bond formation protein DsbB
MTLLDVARPHSLIIVTLPAREATVRRGHAAGNVPGWLARPARSRHMAPMMISRTRPALVRLALALSALAAAAALAGAAAAEQHGLVPCALCLIERWPYWIALVLALAGLALPRALGRVALGLVAAAVLGGAAVAALHVGVEAKWWPSPLPECSAPRVAAGGSIAERLASMPARPAKPCDEPTYLIPGVPLSTAGLNLIFALAFGGSVATFLWLSRRDAP